MKQVDTPEEKQRRNVIMKTKMMFMAAMVTVLLAAGACLPASGESSPNEANIEVTIDEFMDSKHLTREIEVSDGGVLTVSLGSNPTTGFSWTETAQIADLAVLQQTESKFLLTDGKDLVGAPGSQVWTFRALQKGTTTINMEYSRPWEGGEKAEWTFELIVTVR
jgi:inhibitor of cysteine peptidase